MEVYIDRGTYTRGLRQIQGPKITTVDGREDSAVVAYGEAG